MEEKFLDSVLYLIQYLNSLQQLLINSMKPLPSLKQIRDAIPQHCFDRPLTKSFFYLFRDLLLVGIIGTVSALYIPFEITVLTSILWIAYTLVQGTVAVGLFVLAHQCGHQAFSRHKLINDIVGFFIHSAVLVPYFSWQRTHHVHHSKNNHLLDNQTHQPSHIKKSGSFYQNLYKIFGELGIITLQVLVHTFGGWLAYLCIHVTGSRRNPYTKQEYKSTPNHFSPFPSNELFSKEMRPKVFISTAGVLGMLVFLMIVGYYCGFKPVVLLYFCPLSVLLTWLVVITWLQHTDSTIPHLGQDQWTWLKGAMMTVDRNYHWIIDTLHHKIGTTHVLHHLFSEIPHYHAQQASISIKPILGEYYKRDSASILQAIWRIVNQCHYIDDLSGIQYYKSFFKTEEEKHDN